METFTATPVRDDTRTLKTCIHCKILKPLDGGFNRDRGRSDGYRNVCKVCIAAQRKLHDVCGCGRGKLVTSRRCKMCDGLSRLTEKRDEPKFVEGTGMEEWKARAACRKMSVDDYSIFFPKGGDYELARAICAECPVKMACLEYGMKYETAVDVKVDMGMYGGKTPDERSQIRKDKRSAKRREQKSRQRSSTIQATPTQEQLRYQVDET